MELLRSKAGERTVRLDPRTKMVMLFAVSTVLLLGGNGGTMFAVRTAMLLFPFGLLAISGRVRAAGLMLAGGADKKLDTPVSGLESACTRWRPGSSPWRPSRRGSA